VDIVNRRKQIGILRAIGITELAIAISYLVRAMVYSVIGIVVGIVLFKFCIMPLFITHPLRLPIGSVNLIIDNVLLYLRACAIIIASFLGTYIPIRSTLRMHIIDAIWGE
jgi:putative ABC transport system permease protein